MKDPATPDPTAPLASEGADTPTSSPLYRKLAQVRRRIFLNRLIAALCTHCFVALCLFAGYLLGHRLVHLTADPLWVLGGLAGAAVLIASARVVLTGCSSELEAAILVDDALQLRERVSTAVYLRGVERSAGDAQNATGQVVGMSGWKALVERDGSRAVQSVEVRRHFPLRFPRITRWMLVPAVASVALAFFVPQFDLLGLYSNRQADASMEDQLKKNDKFEAILKKAEESLKIAGDPALEELLDEMKKIEKLAEKTADAKPKSNDGTGSEAGKKRTLAKLSKLENLLRRNLDNKKMQGLRSFLDRNRLAAIDPNSLTKRLQRALKKGEFKEAAEALRKLKDEIAALNRKKKISKRELDRLKKLSNELQAVSKNAAGLGNLSGGLQGLAGGLSGANLGQALQGLDKLDMNLAELAKLAEQMKLLDDSLDLAKLSKQNIGKLHKCANCGKPSLKPGGT
jgi:hypothetical protein